MNYRRKLVRLKYALDSAVVDNALKFSLSSGVPALWLGFSDVEKRDVIRGNYSALRNDLDKAAQILTEAVKKNPKSRSAVISLGSLLCQTDFKDYSHAWQMLSESWKLIDKPEKIDQGSFPFFALGVELALLCDPQSAKWAIHNVYFPFIWKYERCDKKDHSPIFYWHVPKTGGTSVNSKLSKIWYRSGTQFLPSYTTRRFFSYVTASHDGVLPYLSSAHISSENIPISAIEKYRKLLVLRDPKDRALSAWRQYRENPAQRMIILPQHGFVWDFFPIRSFSEWLKTAPAPVVNPLRWTFSAYPISNLAASVDDMIPIEELDNFGGDLLRTLGVEGKNENFRVSKNVTNKNIKEGDMEFGDLEVFLEPDYEVYKSFYRLSGFS